MATKLEGNWLASRLDEPESEHLRSPVANAGGDQENRWREEFDADEARLRARGITWEDYLCSRRVDAGLEVLTPNSYPKRKAPGPMGNAGDPAAARDGQFAIEYAQDKARLSARGVSEQDFILSRRLDHGLETLVEQQQRARGAA
ncbi:MAG: hypothetical protein AB7U73_05100 [Pirellulales bacterium]